MKKQKQIEISSLPVALHHQGKPEKCCQCIPIKYGMVFIMLILTLDIFNLILFGLAVLPVASFET